MLLSALAAYKAKGITLNGTNNYYNRGAAMTGIANTTTGTLSMWYTLEGGDGSILKPMTNFGNRIEIYRDASNKWRFFGLTGVGASIMNMTSTSSFTASAGTWHHMAASWSLGASPVFNFYIDGVASGMTANVLLPGIINYANGAEWAVGADYNVFQFFNGSFFDFWFDTGYIDFSVAANLAKFIDSNAKPVNLGAAGDTPTGTAPLLFQHVGSAGVAADFATNLGTGGGMTANGTAIALSATSPTG